jgi:hypothetical protein
VDDIEAIRQLKARYFRTMDTKDWTAMRRVFADDVVMDTSEAGGEVITGADDSRRLAMLHAVCFRFDVEFVRKGADVRRSSDR